MTITATVRQGCCGDKVVYLRTHAPLQEYGVVMIRRSSKLIQRYDGKRIYTCGCIALICAVSARGSVNALGIIVSLGIRSSAVHDLLNKASKTNMRASTIQSAPPNSEHAYTFYVVATTLLQDYCGIVALPRASLGDCFLAAPG